MWNFTSIWLNDTLSMITYADPRSLQPESCIQLNLGIGIMRVSGRPSLARSARRVWAPFARPLARTARSSP